MIRHSLRRVRANPADGTLHCVVHGLLPRNEAIAVLMRAGIESDEAMVERDSHLPRWARLVDWIASRLPARCEPA